MKFKGIRLRYNTRLGATTVLISIIASNILIIVEGIPAFKFPAVQEAFADGLQFETIPAQLIGGNYTSLYVRINPSIVVNQTTQDSSSLHLRLFDFYTNETIDQVSYSITVNKFGDEDKDLIKSNFYSYTGLLTLRIVPKDGEPNILADFDPAYNSWSSPHDEILVESPMLQHGGGLYHIEVRILGTGGNKLAYVPEMAPKYDAWLSIGEAYANKFEYNGQNYNMTAISYYDKIKDFTIDPSTYTIKWSMPFDWNIVRIYQQNNIFVHQEIRLSKQLLSDLDSGSFYAAVNNISLTRNAIAVDPYSSATEMTLHYLLGKATLLELARIYNNGTSSTQTSQPGLMSFTLKINTGDAVKRPETSTELITDTGSIAVNVQWQPKMLSAGTESILNMSFFGFSEADGEKLPIVSDVYYNLTILDKDGNKIVTNENLVAKGGTDIQIINFTSDETYQLVLDITGVSQPFGESLDKSRNGRAIGIVVVPEFDSTILSQNGSNATIVSLALGTFVTVIIGKKVRKLP